MKCLAALLSVLLLLTSCAVPAQITPEPTSSPTESEKVSVMDLNEKVKQLSAMRDLDEIFALEDDTDFAIALDSTLCDWSNYGEALDVLSPEAQTFFLCAALDAEVNNGGFDAFFYNSTGKWGPETVGALETVGAPKTAELLRQFLAPFPQAPYPRDQEERNELLLALPDSITDNLNALDDVFFANPDGLLQDLYVSYAREHRDYFSAPGG